MFKRFFATALLIIPLGYVSHNYFYQTHLPPLEIVKDVKPEKFFNGTWYEYADFPLTI
jgi:hypothetical protein